MGRLSALQTQRISLFHHTQPFICTIAPFFPIFWQLCRGPYQFSLVPFLGVRDTANDRKNKSLCFWRFDTMTRWVRAENRSEQEPCRLVSLLCTFFDNKSGGLTTSSTSIIYHWPREASVGTNGTLIRNRVCRWFLHGCSAHSGRGVCCAACRPPWDQARGLPSELWRIHQIDQSKSSGIADSLHTHRPLPNYHVRHLEVVPSQCVIGSGRDTIKSRCGKDRPSWTMDSTPILQKSSLWLACLPYISTCSFLDHATSLST